MTAFQITLIAAVVFGIVEILTMNFIFLGFAFGMLSVSAVQYVTGEYFFDRDLIIFSIVSCFFIIVIRRVFGKRSYQQRLKQDDINHY